MTRCCPSRTNYLGSANPGGRRGCHHLLCLSVASGHQPAKDGTLALDQTAFNKALTSNPSAVANLFGNSSSTGFADRFNSTINNLLGPTGIVVTKQNDLNQSVTDETSHQTEIQTNLDALRSSYLQQYTTLNATLAQMQQSTSNLASLLA
jgi:flagellar hook-associated protein 2